MFKTMCMVLGATFLALSSSFLSATERKFYSQCKQDAYVYDTFFKEKQNGVFVDIGANDGIKYSNTYFFEQQMGWTGICVEPIPEIFTRLRSNRNCICIHGCVSDKEGIQSFLRVRTAVRGQEMLSGLIDKYDPRHVQRIQREVKRSRGSTEVLSVPCYTFNQLLRDHNIHHVDYLSIDTEGGELDILKSIDFTRTAIDVIDVENAYKSPEFQQFLESQGYKKMATLAQDEIYRKVRE